MVVTDEVCFAGPASAVSDADDASWLSSTGKLDLTRGLIASPMTTPAAGALACAGAVFTMSLGTIAVATGWVAVTVPWVGVGAVAASLTLGSLLASPESALASPEDIFVGETEAPGWGLGGTLAAAAIVALLVVAASCCEAGSFALVAAFPFGFALLVGFAAALAPSVAFKVVPSLLAGLARTLPVAAAFGRALPSAGALATRLTVPFELAAAFAFVLGDVVLAAREPDCPFCDAVPAVSPVDVTAGRGAAGVAACGGFASAEAGSGCGADFVPCDAAAFASSKAENVCVSCAGGGDGSHCEVATQSGALISDAILGTAKSLQKMTQGPACNRRATSICAEN